MVVKKCGRALQDDGTLALGDGGVKIYYDIRRIYSLAILKYIYGSVYVLAITHTAKPRHPSSRLFL